jgi:hypothetical protein
MILDFFKKLDERPEFGSLLSRNLNPEHIIEQIGDELKDNLLANFSKQKFVLKLTKFKFSNIKAITRKIIKVENLFKDKNSSRIQLLDLSNIQVSSLSIVALSKSENIRSLRKILFNPDPD